MIGYQDVAAVLVTRGDVDMQPILDTLPYGQVVIWDNSARPYNLKVWGRYAALAEVNKPVVYFQDDDCLVTCHDQLLDAYEPETVVGNAFPDAERLNRYKGTTLLGWGAIFDSHLPWVAFQQYSRYYPIDDEFRFGLGAEMMFPALSRNKTVTYGVEWLAENDGPVLERENRMWKQPGFYDECAFWFARTKEIREQIRRTDERAA